jgi:hypothetical protein
MCEECYGAEQYNSSEEDGNYEDDNTPRDPKPKDPPAPLDDESTEDDEKSDNFCQNCSMSMENEDDDRPDLRMCFVCWEQVYGDKDWEELTDDEKKKKKRICENCDNSFEDEDRPKAQICFKCRELGASTDEDEDDKLKRKLDTLLGSIPSPSDDDKKDRCCLCQQDLDEYSGGTMDCSECHKTVCEGCIESHEDWKKCKDCKNRTDMSDHYICPVCVIFDYTFCHKCEAPWCSNHMKYMRPLHEPAKVTEGKRCCDLDHDYYEEVVDGCLRCQEDFEIFSQEEESSSDSDDSNPRKRKSDSDDERPHKKMNTSNGVGEGSGEGREIEKKQKVC